MTKRPNQELVLIRGIPGSGKSTFAKKLCKIGFHHVETDQFWIDSMGNYKFNPGKLREAHNWCRGEVERLLLEGKSVVVSNTFIKLWEMEQYFRMSYEIIGTGPVVITMLNEFKNVHGVPEKKVNEMMRNFEWELEDVDYYD